MSKNIQKIKEFAFMSHEETNHYYDKERNLKYSYHLQMVANNAEKFLHLIPIEFHEDVVAAAYCHDLIEDARISYNDIVKVSNKNVAEICYACTNYGRGRNRIERMPDYIYNEIKSIPYALYVKLCDRMANVQYGLLTGSDKPKMYKKENVHFKSMLYTEGVLEEMWNELDKLFDTI